ncbi:MAG: UvrD-helicase domain-containing protein [Candidatus Micrarchaeota archaeon]
MSLNKNTIPETLDEYRTVLDDILITKLLLFFSYPLTLLYLGIPIRKKAKTDLVELSKKQTNLNKKLQLLVQLELDDAKQQISQLHQNKTYLIYPRKQELLAQFRKLIDSLSHLQSYSSIFDDEFNSLVCSSLITIENDIEKINSYNKEFVNLRKIDYKSLWNQSTMKLDDDQLTSIVTDDKYNLIVAGAGSGKTEVLTTRIAYLIKRKPDAIEPERILALAFQNKAASEIRERLEKRFNVKVKIITFHKLGKDILEMTAKKNNRATPNLMFSGDNFEKEYYRFIKKLFGKIFTESQSLKSDIIDYMKYYADSEIVREEKDFEIKEDYYKYISSFRYTALNGTKVKSEAERQILNFFVMHDLNGDRVDIRYEVPATWMKIKHVNTEYDPKPDFYFPSFKLYLEHWALDKNGKVPDWFEGDNPTEHYLQSMKLKKEEFKKQKKFKLIETFSWEFNGPEFLNKLENRFLQALKERYHKDFTFAEISYEQLVDRVWDECRSSVKVLERNIGNFILIAKTYHLTPKDIKKKLNDGNWTCKQRAFANIAIRIYEEYENTLRRENSIDFADMINLAIQELENDESLCHNMFDHILIDEYQDISKQRYQLIKTLMNKNPECKLFCVGDDWQSIMGFTGSDVDFFVHFDQYFDHPARTDLTKNYRSIKSVVDTGAHIIKQNKKIQLEKKTIANDERIKRIKIYSLLHKKDYKDQYYMQMAKHCVDKIGEYLKKGLSPKDIMILTRITSNAKLVNALLAYAKSQRIPIVINDVKYDEIPVMSVHKSKGLQSRVVFILNVVKDTYGFPCEIQNPDIFEPAILGRKKDKEEEERRLFYVAVTRAKEDVHIYSQKCSESKFIKEIKEFCDVEELEY